MTLVSLFSACDHYYTLIPFLYIKMVFVLEFYLGGRGTEGVHIWLAGYVCFSFQQGNVCSPKLSTYRDQRESVLRASLTRERDDRPMPERTVAATNGVALGPQKI